MRDMQRLGAELETRYNGYDVCINLEGKICLSLQIKKVKSLGSEKILVLSDGVYNDMYIDSCSISDVEISEESILINMVRGTKIIIKRKKEGKN